MISMDLLASSYDAVLARIWDALRMLLLDVQPNSHEIFLISQSEVEPVFWRPVWKRSSEDMQPNPCKLYAGMYYVPVN